MIEIEVEKYKRFRMFKKMNLYTVLTFVVYPVFFTAILVCLFLTCSRGDTTALLTEENAIVNEEQEFNQKANLNEPSEAKDSLYLSRGDFSTTDSYR